MILPASFPTLAGTLGTVLELTLRVLAIGGKGTESPSLELQLGEGLLPEDNLSPEFWVDVDGVLLALEVQEEDRELLGVGIELDLDGFSCTSLKFDVSSILCLLSWSGQFLAMTNKFSAKEKDKEAS